MVVKEIGKLGIRLSFLFFYWLCDVWWRTFQQSQLVVLKKIMLTLIISLTISKRVNSFSISNDSIHCYVKCSQSWPGCPPNASSDNATLVSLPYGPISIYPHFIRYSCVLGVCEKNYKVYQVKFKMPMDQYGQNSNIIFHSLTLKPKDAPKIT